MIGCVVVSSLRLELYVATFMAVAATVAVSMAIIVSVFIVATGGN